MFSGSRVAAIFQTIQYVTVIAFVLKEEQGTGICISFQHPTIRVAIGHRSFKPFLYESIDLVSHGIMAPIPKISPRHFCQAVQTQMFLLQSQLPATDQTGPRQHQIRQRTPPYVLPPRHGGKHKGKSSESVKEKEKNALKKRNFFFFKSKKLEEFLDRPV